MSLDNVPLEADFAVKIVGGLSDKWTIYRAHVYVHRIEGKPVYCPAVARLGKYMGRVYDEGGTIVFGIEEMAFDQPKIAFAMAKWFAEEIREQHIQGIQGWLEQQKPMEPPGEDAVPPHPPVLWD